MTAETPISRTLVVGDIHGCLRSLEALAAMVKFSANDRLVLLGDYVDRGPDSRGVIDWVLATSRSIEVIALRGNHEVMMLESRTNRTLAANWSSFGGLEALESYGTSVTEDWVARVPMEHWKSLESTRRNFETEHFIIVHGGLDSDRNLADQDPYRLIWGRCYDMAPHVSGNRSNLRPHAAGRRSHRGLSLGLVHRHRLLPRRLAHLPGLGVG